MNSLPSPVTNTNTNTNKNINTNKNTNTNANVNIHAITNTNTRLWKLYNIQLHSVYTVFIRTTSLATNVAPTEFNTATLKMQLH